ncbi:hypothetical protein EIP91_000073 [Steccherinum ochraceum]|uniref:Uncharacterized protein n=1 Tax=Steccherinum ochraceum TaxID=92696 RepID=A0A4R0RST5_9APHY|nr:hypothetical protein EIP91_000073 [Steccherinum ochraceum]
MRLTLSTLLTLAFAAQAILVAPLPLPQTEASDVLSMHTPRDTTNPSPTDPLPLLKRGPVQYANGVTRPRPQRKLTPIPWYPVTPEPKAGTTSPGRNVNAGGEGGGEGGVHPGAGGGGATTT